MRAEDIGRSNAHHRARPFAHPRAATPAFLPRLPARRRVLASAPSVRLPTPVATGAPRQWPMLCVTVSAADVPLFAHADRQAPIPSPDPRRNRARLAAAAARQGCSVDELVQSYLQLGGFRCLLARARRSSFACPCP